MLPKAGKAIACTHDRMSGASSILLAHKRIFDDRARTASSLSLPSHRQTNSIGELDSPRSVLPVIVSCRHGRSRQGQRDYKRSSEHGCRRCRCCVCECCEALVLSPTRPPSSSISVEFRVRLQTIVAGGLESDCRSLPFVCSCCGYSSDR